MLIKIAKQTSRNNQYNFIKVTLIKLVSIKTSNSAYAYVPYQNLNFRY